MYRASKYDDSLVLFQAKSQDCLQVRSCLVRYERTSGQIINFEKSALTYSPNTTAQIASVIKSILSMEVVNGHEIYLGLTTFSLASKKSQVCILKGTHVPENSRLEFKIFFLLVVEKF